MQKTQQIQRESNINLAITVCCIYFLLSMAISPAKYISTSLNGITAWAFNVLPSVLPFMFFTRVLSSQTIMQKITKPFSVVTTPLFKTPPISIYAFIMAIMSGYPVGSKLVADLYIQGKISKQDAFKMTTFCSTSGPMFIIGAVGISMFKNSKIGYVLFLSHFLGAILNGILYRDYKLPAKYSEAQTSTNKTDHLQKQSDLNEIVLNSTLAILSVGCIITIFFIIIESLAPLLSLLPQTISYFLEGTIEITKGCIDLSSLSNTNLAAILCSFAISFGGISTVLQSLTMLSKLKMPTSFFIRAKLTHALFSSIITAIIMLL